MVTVPPLAAVYTIRLVDMMILPFSTETIKNGLFEQTFAWSNRLDTAGCDAIARPTKDFPLSLDHPNDDDVLHAPQNCGILTIGRECGSTAYSVVSISKKPVL